MATAEVLVFTESFFANAPGSPVNPTSQTGWDERSLRAQLGLIAQAWFRVRRYAQKRTRTSSPRAPVCFENPLQTPDDRAPWPRPIARGPEPPAAPQKCRDPSGTGENARRTVPLRPHASPEPSSSFSAVSHRRAEDDLLRDSSLRPTVDFRCRDGLREHANKKKKKAASTPFNWDDNGDKKDENPDGGNGENNAGGQGGGDAGNGGDGNGDNNGGDGALDDDWATFTTAKSKKKKGKAADADAGGLPDIPTSDFGGDAFHEIKLGDDSGGKLDLGLGAADSKNTLGSWGTKWNTGGTTWDWAGGGTGNDAGGGVDDANPWSKSKKKDKTSLSFGVIDETEGQQETAKDADWGFATSKKDKKKKNSLWDAEPEAKEPQAPASNAWGWDSKKPKDEPAEDDWFVPGKKDKKKTNNILDDFGTTANTATTAPEEPAADDFWGAVTKNGKKKKKGGLYDDATETPAPEPPPAANTDNDFGWGLGSGKKKKNSIFPEDPKEDNSKAGGDSWDLWGSGKKDKKKNALFDDTPAAPEEPAKDDIWDWGGGSKKDKKKKATDDLIQLDDAPATGGGGGDDDFFSSFGTGKKDRKSGFSWADDTNDDWDLKKAGDDVDKDAEDKAKAEAEAFEIAAEEDELAALEAKKAKKGKLVKKDKERYEVLKAKADLRAEEKAAAETEQNAKADEEEKAKSDAQAAEIAADEEELAALEEKKANRGGKLLKKDRERYDVLKMQSDLRADEKAAAEADAAGGPGEPPADGEDAARAEAEAFEVAAEEEELAALEAKKAKRGKLMKKDKDRYDDLKMRADQRAEEKAAKDAGDAAATGDPDPPSAEAGADDAAREAEEADARAEEAELAELESKKALRGRLVKSADRERYQYLKDRADRRADDKAAKEADVNADSSPPGGDGLDPVAQEADDVEIAAEEQELADLEIKKAKKGRLARAADRERYDYLKDRADKRAEEKAAKTAAGDPEPAEAEATSTLEADGTAAREAEEAEAAADEAELAELEAKKAKKGRFTRSADRERYQLLQDRISQRAEQKDAKDAEELTPGPDAEPEPSPAEDAPTPEDIAAEEQELADLEVRKAKKGRLAKSADRERYQYLKERADQRAEDKAAKETEEPAAPAEPEPDTPEVDEVEVAAEEQELADLEAKRARRGKFVKSSDRERYEYLKDRSLERAGKAAAKEAEDPAAGAEPEPDPSTFEEPAAPEADEADVAAEEQELADLEAKRARRGKFVRSSDRERYQYLKERSEHRAAKPFQEPEPEPEPESQQPGLDEADIAAEEQELADLEAKRARRGKFVKTSDRERYEHLKERSEQRAAKTTKEPEPEPEPEAQQPELDEADIAAEEQELADLEAKRARRGKFVKTSDRERYEHLKERSEQRAAKTTKEPEPEPEPEAQQPELDEADIAAEEQELADLEAKRARRGKFVKSSDRERYEYLKVRSEQRAAKVPEEPVALLEPEPEAKPAQSEADGADVAAEEAELAELEAKKAKKGRFTRSADRERYQYLMDRADQRAAAPAADAEADVTAENVQAPEAEGPAAADVEEVDIAAEEEELASLEARKAKRGKLAKSADRERYTFLKERSDKRAEQRAAEEAAAKEAEAAEMAAEEAELAELETRMAKRGRLSKKSERERYDVLKERAEQRAAAGAPATNDATAGDAQEAALQADQATPPEVDEVAAAEIAAEDEELEALEMKKEKRGGKLLKKDRERYDVLKERADSRAAEKADATGAEGAGEAEAEAAGLGEEKKREKKSSKDKDKDKKKTKDAEPEPEAAPELDPDEVDKLLADVDRDRKPKSTSDAFSFWGLGTSKKSNKVLEDTLNWEETTPSNGNDAFGSSSRKPVGGKIADRLKPFEASREQPKQEAVAPPSPPPDPPAAAADKKRSSKSSKKSKAPPADEAGQDHSTSSKKSKGSSEIPGTFPEEPDEDDLALHATDMSPKKDKKSKKSKTKSSSEAAPPPPPAVPDPPPSPPPEPRPTKKERPKISRDGGSSWGMWSAAPARKDERDKKSSSRSKPDKEKPSSKRSGDKEGREKATSSKGSGSDKVEHAEKPDKADKSSSRPRASGLFSTPPISRSMSTKEKRSSAAGRSSRRHSVDAYGLASPPPEDLPEMSSKAAKILGVGGGDRTSNKRKSHKARATDDEGLTEAEAHADKAERRRSRRPPPDEDDAHMTEGEVPLRRGGSTSKKGGISGLFSGFMTPKADRADLKRRSTYATTDDEARGPGLDPDTPMPNADREARRAARRAKRAEREAAPEAAGDSRKDKSEARRERRHREDEEAADREARRAERRAARQHEEELRREEEDKEARRAERRRVRKERETAAAAAEEADEASRRAAKRDRRRSHHIDPSEDEAERRRRRESRRAGTGKEDEPERLARHGSRRHAEQSGDEAPPRRHKRHESSAWPLSGTSSWVKDHSDAPPPPDQAEDEQARREARRARRRARNGETTADETDDQRRRRRREERGREKRMAASEGSDERHHSRRNSLFMDTSATPRTSWWKKLAG